MRRRRAPWASTLKHPLTELEAITFHKVSLEVVRAIITELLALKEHGEVAYYLIRSEQYVRVTVNGICVMQICWNALVWEEFAPSYAQYRTATGGGYLNFDYLLIAHRARSGEPVVI